MDPGLFQPVLSESYYLHLSLGGVALLRRRHSSNVQHSHQSSLFSPLILEVRIKILLFSTQPKTILILYFSSCLENLENGVK